MQGLSFLAHAGRADLARVLILRAASDYTIAPPGMPAADFLAKETHEGFPATPEALNALYLVASPVAAYLADNWDRTRDSIPVAVGRS
jgi:purine nucleoside permease